MSVRTVSSRERVEDTQENEGQVWWIKAKRCIISIQATSNHKSFRFDILSEMMELKLKLMLNTNESFIKVLRGKSDAAASSNQKQLCKLCKCFLIPGPPIFSKKELYVLDNPDFENTL